MVKQCPDIIDFINGYCYVNIEIASDKTEKLSGEVKIKYKNDTMTPLRVENADSHLRKGQIMLLFVEDFIENTTSYFGLRESLWN